MKTKEIVYIIMDLLKNKSGDSYFTEDHILFLLRHNRALILKKEQERNRFIDNAFNTQTICLDMSVSDEGACGQTMLRSEQKVPTIISGQDPVVSFIDYYTDYRVSFVSPVKMKYIGNNKFMRNIVYCSIGPDMHMYAKSGNAQFINIKKMTLQSVFENSEDANAMSCDTQEGSSQQQCDPLDKEFPMDSHLVPLLIDQVLKELIGAQYRPVDNTNDDTDNLAALEAFIRNNMKSPITKQIEGNE